MQMARAVYFCLVIPRVIMPTRNIAYIEPLYILATSVNDIQARLLNKITQHSVTRQRTQATCRHF